MAVDITGALPQLDNFTTGSADVVTKVTVGAAAGFVTFRPRTNAGKVVFGAAASTLTDGGALGAAEYVVLVADAATQIKVQGTRTFFVTSATASTVVEVVVEGGS
jgi:hypothetical protein